MEENVSKYTNAIGSGKQAITQGQKRKGGRGMREGWEYICFESCLNKIPKAKQVTTKEYNSGTKYPIISQEDKLISGYYDDESMLFHIDKPVIIFGDHTRVLKYIDFDFVVGADGVKIISPKENLNAKFLLYFLTWYNIPNLGYSRHYKLLKELDIPVPPLSTQLSIVSELDKINELIRLKREQLKDYDNLAQSIFYEMFGDPVVNEKGWEVKKLGEVSMIKTGPFGSMLHKEDYITGGIPLINPMHIQNFKAVPDKDFTISMEKAAELCNYQLKINDVIFARRGDIGRCAVISDKEAGYLCGTGSLFVRFERKLSSVYTMYAVRTTSFIKELVSKAKGATMLNLNSSTMENLRFPIPPLPLQQLFAQRIELIEKQKAEIQRTISDLETLLASRMQYWFD